MTNYADMPAGPEMDRAIITKVMGWTIKRHYQPAGMIFHARDDDAIFVNGEMKWWADVWRPSTNFAHAWEVVAVVRSRFARVSISWGKDGCDCSLIAGEGSIFETAPTAPLAICRAALIAMESK